MGEVTGPSVFSPPHTHTLCSSLLNPVHYGRWAPRRKGNGEGRFHKALLCSSFINSHPLYSFSFGGSAAADRDASFFTCHQWPPSGMGRKGAACLAIPCEEKLPAWQSTHPPNCPPPSCLFGWKQGGEGHLWPSLRTCTLGDCLVCLYGCIGPGSMVDDEISAAWGPWRGHVDRISFQAVQLRVGNVDCLWYCPGKVLLSSCVS